MEKSLYLHVGHGKTGSSYIQSILSTHKKAMLDNYSIFYPSVQNDHSAQGKISSGNGALFLNNPSDPIHVHNEAGENSILYSSEFLFGLQKKWINIKTINGLFDFYDKIEVLLFIRNPDEMLSSAYQQAVKRGGYTKSIDEYSEIFKFVSELHEFLENITRFGRVNLQVFNYSNRKKEVSKILSSWLGMDEVLDVPFPPINRSLTYAELALQSEINRFFGRSGDLVADDLCEKLPEIRSDVIRPGEAAWSAFYQKNLPLVGAINAMVPPSEHLMLQDKIDDIRSMQTTLDVSQIRVIAQSLFGKMMRKA